MTGCCCRPLALSSLDAWAPDSGAGTYATCSQVHGLAFLFPLHRQENQGFSMVGASATVGDMMLAKVLCCAGREGGQ